MYILITISFRTVGFYKFIVKLILPENNFYCNYDTEKIKDSKHTNNICNEGRTIYKSQFVGIDNKPYPTKCLLCDLKFVLPENEKDLLTHLFKEHRLIIGDVWKIASLKRFKLILNRSYIS